MFMTILMLGFGIIAIVKGEFKITRKKMVKKTVGRMLGVILLVGAAGSLIPDSVGGFVQLTTLVSVIAIGLFNSENIKTSPQSEITPEKTINPIQTKTATLQTSVQLETRLKELVTEAETWGEKNGWPAGDAYPQYPEIREIGMKLNKMGGIELMRTTYYEVKRGLPFTTIVERMWDRIGEWQS